MIISEKAKAKLNLHLEVGNKNSSINRHDLIASFNFLILCDFFSIEINKTDKHDSQISFDISYSKKLEQHLSVQDRSKKELSEKISAEDSLMQRAVKAYFSAYGIPLDLYRINIEMLKCVPDMSGLGGGSSDAAALLRALVTYFEKEDDRITQICESLGSDVYPCYLNKPLIQRSINGISSYESTNQQSKNKYTVLLLKPPISCKTEERYDLLGRNKDIESSFSKSIDQLKKDLCNVLETPYKDQEQIVLFNDFYDSVRKNIPEMEQAVECCNSGGATFVSLTGSGSCLFALFERAENAQKCYLDIQRKFENRWWQTITFFK